MRVARLGSLLAAVLLGACATQRGEEQVGNLVRRTVDASRSHYQGGRLGEAAVLLRAVERVAPDDAGVVALKDEIGSETLPLIQSGRLGMNRRPRTRVERSVPERIALYPIDRLADLVDLVSFDVGVALGGAIRLHVTRAFQGGFGMGWQYGVGLVQPRILGAQQELEIGVAALNYAQFQVSGRRSGITGPVATGSADATGASTPDLGLYQDYRDYWSVGAGVRVGIVGANAAVHPVQFLDLLLGFLLIDIGNDDRATTRALRLTPANRRALIQLNEVEEVRQYGP
jgi:hypothetical protein